MKRRDFLQRLGGSGLAAAMSFSLPGLIGRAQAETTIPWDGPVFLSCFLRGGMDQSSWTDPRNNPAINRYANSGGAGRAGNIWYAPLGENQAFFEKYYDRMLVINGVDLQSGSHSSAGQHQQTGRLANGYPSISALYAAVAGQGLPIPWLVFGGPQIGGGIQAYTRLTDGVSLASLANANRRRTNSLYLRGSDWEILQRYRLERLERLAAQPNDNLPYEQRQLEQLFSARSNHDLFARLQSRLPQAFDYEGSHDRVERVLNGIHKALVCFAAGISVSAGIEAYLSWDTHHDHDQRIDDLCLSATRTLDYLWSKAEALGIDDRLLVHVNSDVGRTPHYNSKNGKDHWQATTNMLMMKNQPWTNRIVGLSGPEHEKTAINPQTLQADSAGTMLRPAHIHRSIRRILGIDQTPLAEQFDFDEPELDLLDSGKSSPLLV